MKLNFLSVFAVSISIFCPIESAQATIWDDYLAQVEGEFDRATTPQKKYEIISEPVNREYLESLNSISDLDLLKLKMGVGKGVLSYMATDGRELENNSRVTALNLAISLGKVDAVRKFLGVVSDVNADELTSWGFGQPYYPAHCALDPYYPKSKGINMRSRLEIIDILAAKGADFNRVFRYIYANTPLSAGEPRGCFVDRDNIDRLRARALIYGADPALKGSSNIDVRFKPESRKGIYYPITQHLVDYHFEVVTQKGSQAVRPVPAVIKIMLEYLGSPKRMFPDFYMNGKRLIKLDNQIANLDKEITKFRAQKTKKARKKVRHLETVKAELERDRKKASKALNRFNAPSVF